MIKLSGEALVISALLNSGDVDAARSYGITEAHFASYQNEYCWLLNFAKKYTEQPTWEIFSLNYPGFPVSGYADVRSAVDLMLKRFHTKELTVAINDASKCIGTGDVETAWEILSKSRPVFTSARPRNLITDATFLDTFDTIDSTIELPSRSLQRWTRGIGQGQLWYVGARLGNGKSAHLLNWAINAIIEGYRVKFYSLEMTEMELRGRAHAILAHRYGFEGISSLGIRDRTVNRMGYKKFIAELEDKVVGKLDVHTPAEGSVSPASIASTISDYDLVVVDHVGLLRADGGGYSTDDWRVAARNSNALRELTLASNVPVLAAAQINREGEAGKNPPDVKNLAGTDALGQDADVVVTLRAKPYDVATSFYLPKNRHGYSKKRWWTKFDPNHGDFTEVDEDQAEELVLRAEENE